jgi:hypothetical protein
VRAVHRWVLDGPDPWEGIEEIPKPKQNRWPSKAKSALTK